MVRHEFYADWVTVGDDLSARLEAGGLRPVTTVADGFDNLPVATVGLYTEPHYGQVREAVAGLGGAGPAISCVGFHPTSPVRGQFNRRLYLIQITPPG